MNITNSARAFAGVKQWLVLLCRCAANATSVDLGWTTSAKEVILTADIHTIVRSAASGHREEIMGGGSWEGLVRETAQGGRVDKSHSKHKLAPTLRHHILVGAMDVVGRLSFFIILKLLRHSQAYL